MDEKPDQIIGHIEAQRSELGRNLNELENKVRRSTDWRTYYDRNPMLILGAALGGGVLLGATIGGTDKGGRSYYKTRYPKSSGKAGIAGKSYSGAGYSGSTSHIGGTYNPSRHDTVDAGSSGVTSSGPSPSASSAASAGESYYGSPRSASSSAYGSSQGLMSSLSQSQHMKQISETLDHVKGALIAFGITKAKEFLAQAVPGLEQHLGDLGGGGHHDSSQHFSGQGSSAGSQGRSSQQYGSGSGQTSGQGSQSYGGQGTGSGYGSGSGSQGSVQDTRSGTGTGANDYRSGSQGAGQQGAGSTTSSSFGTGNTGSSSPGSSNTGTFTQNRENDQFAGAGSGRNPAGTP